MWRLGGVCVGFREFKKFYFYIFFIIVNIKNKFKKIKNIISINLKKYILKITYIYRNLNRRETCFLQHDLLIFTLLFDPRVIASTGQMPFV